MIKELEAVFLKENIEVDSYQIASKAIRGCMVCNYCYEYHECVFKDDVNNLGHRMGTLGCSTAEMKMSLNQQDRHPHHM